ncbi:PepSY domain-containing protein [Cytophagaceae bacterium DM2B3-1]|uniref:PepSY domain-containing protein n=1 Tax=Xanthocytophaga flava TaxID=3048013 RepID=A0ABT7CIG6_9BACT|nr:PepSY domain-containing protein [Xanthocytophaga flavus]MDJ1493526.1 PepSY domain-containing protein [Xanthocytophaga flavus]
MKQVTSTLESQPLSLKDRVLRLIRRNMYQWHRVLGIITVIPVIFWTLSGLMHPFMSHWFKPTIAHDFIPQYPIQKNQIKLSVAEVLKQNKITKFKNFRFITLDKQTYYQIKDTTNHLLYFSTQNGRPLPNGDIRYAELLARYLIDDYTSPILAITQITEFDHEYKYINRLLPVWKVSFDRSDRMDVMIETEQSRMATFNTQGRKTFIRIFDLLHNWSFLEMISNKGLQITIMLMLLAIISLSTGSGIVVYGFLWKRFKKTTAGNTKGILKKYHRQIGIAVSLVTFAFAGSGAWHLVRKLTPDERNKFVYEPVFKTAEVEVASLMPDIQWDRLLNIQIVKIGRTNYFQLFYDKTELESAEVIYQHTYTQKMLKDGSVLYAKYLANKFANLANVNGSLQSACCDLMSDVANADISNDNLLHAEILTRFDREYGFVNKRLPVVKLDYNTPEKTSYYIEPATSRLAAKIENTDRAEGWSFAILHKYLLLEWAGKNVRDFVTLLSATGVLITSIFGLVLFIKNR